MRAWHSAARGELDPFVLVVEGSVPNEEINGEGHWSGFGVDGDGQPITSTTWIDRLAPRAAVVLALGTCAAYGGVPAMRNNPTGAMGLRDHLGHGFVSRRGAPLINLPGCPVHPDAITETLQRIALEIGVWLLDRVTTRDVRSGCSSGRRTRRATGPVSPSTDASPTRWQITARASPRWAGRTGSEVQRAGARLGERRRRLPERRRHLHRVHDARLSGSLHAVHGQQSARAPQHVGRPLPRRTGAAALPRAEHAPASRAPAYRPSGSCTARGAGVAYVGVHFRSGRMRDGGTGADAESTPRGRRAPVRHGPDVESVQRALGVDVDGQYGLDTGGAVRNWKFRSGYPPRAMDDQLGVPGQRMLLGSTPRRPPSRSGPRSARRARARSTRSSSAAAG